MVPLRCPFVVRDVETDRVLQKAFDEVFRIPASAIYSRQLIGGLRPKVSGIKRVPTIFDRNQMVFLVTAPVV